MSEECCDIKVCETYNVGVNPASLAITSDGHYAYVANNNNYGIPGSDSVTVLNLKKGVPKLTIHDSSFAGPYRIAIDKCGKFAYVCNSNSTTVSIINIHTNKVIGIINGFDGPGGIVLSKKLAYVTNYGAGNMSGLGNTVSVVDLKTRQIINTITVDLAPAALALNPCYDYLYVICYVDGNPLTGTLNIISTKTNTIITTITGFSGPFGIALTHDAHFAYISSFGSNNFSPYGTTVSIVDLKKHHIIKNIEVGIQPASITISHKYAYVSNYNALYAGPNFTNLTYGQGTVNIICLKTNRVIAPTIPVGQTPSTIVLSPCNNKLYVCNYVQNTVTTICLE